MKIKHWVGLAKWVLASRDRTMNLSWLATVSVALGVAWRLAGVIA